jgi:hypothetical protein
MEVTFSTADVHPRDRMGYWREVACRAFVDLECHARRSATFSANIRSGPFAALGLSVVESDACVVTSWIDRRLRRHHPNSLIWGSAY